VGYIYGFRLNNSDEFRYIGMTVNIHKRYIGHKNSASRGENLPVYRWIRSKGFKNIEMVVLDEADNSSLADLEMSWIKRLTENGHRLLNLTSGGEGALGYRHSDKQRAKWSQERKGSITGDKNPNYGKFGPDHPSYGRKFSEETKKRLSEQKMGKNNPNYGKKYSEEERKEMSRVRKGKPMPSSSRSAHTRYHVNLSGFSEKCNYCKESK
jgi:group I intron endonuclease